MLVQYLLFKELGDIVEDTLVQLGVYFSYPRL